MLRLPALHRTVSLNPRICITSSDLPRPRAGCTIRVVRPTPARQARRVPDFGQGETGGHSRPRAPSAAANDLPSRRQGSNVISGDYLKIEGLSTP